MRRTISVERSNASASCPRCTRIGGEPDEDHVAPGDVALGVATNQHAAWLGAEGGTDEFLTLGLVSAHGSRRLYIWYGGESPMDEALDASMVGPAEFGGVTTLRWIGDTDKDGLADLAWADARIIVWDPGPGAVVVLR